MPAGRRPPGAAAVEGGRGDRRARRGAEAAAFPQACRRGRGDRRSGRARERADAEGGEETSRRRGSGNAAQAHPARHPRRPQPQAEDRGSDERRRAPTSTDGGRRTPTEDDRGRVARATGELAPVIHLPEPRARTRTATSRPTGRASPALADTPRAPAADATAAASRPRATAETARPARTAPSRSPRRRGRRAGGRDEQPAVPSSARGRRELGIHADERVGGRLTATLDRPRASNARVCRQARDPTTSPWTTRSSNSATSSTASATARRSSSTACRPRRARRSSRSSCSGTSRSPRPCSPTSAARRS